MCHNTSPKKRVTKGKMMEDQKFKWLISGKDSIPLDQNGVYLLLRLDTDGGAEARRAALYYGKIVDDDGFGPLDEIKRYVRTYRKEQTEKWKGCVPKHMYTLKGILEENFPPDDVPVGRALCGYIVLLRGPSWQYYITRTKDIIRYKERLPKEQPLLELIYDYFSPNAKKELKRIYEKYREYQIISGSGSLIRGWFRLPPSAVGEIAGTPQYPSIGDLGLLSDPTTLSGGEDE